MRNWSEYEAGLRNRGSLTVWLGFDADGGTIRTKRKRGRQKQYSKMAIETALRIGAVYHLRLRQAEGFLHSLFSLQVLFGPAMSARRLAAQRAKAKIRCQILNTMTSLGMTDGYMVR